MIKALATIKPGYYFDIQIYADINTLNIPVIEKCKCIELNFYIALKTSQYFPSGLGFD